MEIGRWISNLESSKIQDVVEANLSCSSGIKTPSTLTCDQGRVFALMEPEEQRVPKLVASQLRLARHHQAAAVPRQEEGSSKASALQRVGVGSWHESGNIHISKYVHFRTQQNCSY